MISISISPVDRGAPILNFSYKIHFSFTVVHDEQRYNKPFSTRPSMDLAVWDGTQQGRALGAGLASFVLRGVGAGGRQAMACTKTTSSG